jgi:hypothetical protein
MIGCGEIHDLWDLVLVTVTGGKTCSDIRAGQADAKRPVSLEVTIPDVNRQQYLGDLPFFNYIITIFNHFNVRFYPRLQQTWIWFCQIDNSISNK